MNDILITLQTQLQNTQDDLANQQTQLANIQVQIDTDNAAIVSLSTQIAALQDPTVTSAIATAIASLSANPVSLGSPAPAI